MESSVKFSILVPVYKVEQYIDECIQSVLKQTYPNFELILVDDGSPDKSGEICEEYAKKDERVKVFHKPNGGAFETRCYAVERISGDYCIFLDSDDYLALNTLEILERNIKLHGADCIIYGIEWARPGGAEHIKCREEYCGRLITDKAEVLNIVLNDQSYNSLCRKCVKSSCFDGRDFSPYYHIKNGEDRLQSTEILENAKSFLFIPEELYYYRVNAESITHTINYDGYKADFTVDEYCMNMLKKLGVFSQADYSRLRNSILDALVIQLKKLSRFCSSKANSVDGMKQIRESSYYLDFLSAGYKKVPALPSVNETTGLRRFLNNLVITLFNARLYSIVIFFNKHIYK